MQQHDILIFTETWLSPNIKDEDIKLTNFNLSFRNDRTDRQGGGAPRATRYAELGASWNSEVNKGNHARQGSVLFDLLCDLKVESKTVGILVIQYIDKETLYAKCTFYTVI